MRSRYIPIKKANVYISNGFRKLFYGIRTLYSKDFTGQRYVRYKNRYYKAYFDGRYTYTVRL